MNKTISNEKLESAQAYTHYGHMRRDGVYQCQNCMLFKVTDEDKEHCDECQKWIDITTLTECVKCECVVEILKTSSDGLCSDCWLEENPC